jgi:hypothetical protein
VIRTKTELKLCDVARRKGENELEASQSKRGGEVTFERKSAMQMPELLVFVRLFVVGLVTAEVFRLTWSIGIQFGRSIADINPAWRLGVAVLIGAICAGYFWARQGVDHSIRLYRSYRVDLLAMLVLGAWTNLLIENWLERLHKMAAGVGPFWAPTIIGVLTLMMASALWRTYLPRKPEQPQQFFFLTDDEIAGEADDVLGSNEQANSFAATVLASGSHAGIVFGIDAPWGTGKTSFLNLAQRHWETTAPDSLIVFRFEPLRYASDTDLADKLIRDLSAVIQREVYVPEFRPAASRYSRMLKGRTDFSFFGLKFSIEPSSETVDELLDDIDAVLKRIRRRVIVIIDDLDRLDAKSINNVLFIARRTFRLTQAAYILCYDTEILVGAKDEGEKARHFLEKFVNVKLSLFIDSKTLQEFLLHDWKKKGSGYPSIPADTMIKLSAVLGELAAVLRDDNAAKYLPLVGDLRKIKRFVNAILLLQLEKTDLSQSDFNGRDLLNLILLHLHFPGLFRRIYAEETEGRSGAFSVRREVGSGTSRYVNAPQLQQAIEPLRGGVEEFLLIQLFDVEALGIDDTSEVDEATRSSRACFNDSRSRNLEKFLKLIVRFSTPEPSETFRLYQVAVARVVEDRELVSAILTDGPFSLASGERSHDQFWRILLSKSYDFDSRTANDAIKTLVKYLPSYSTIEADGRGLRPRSIYSLILLLDRAGWGRTSGKRRSNSAENIVEVARRIFGEAEYEREGLIDQLAAPERGVLGWYDLLLFRLQCSADRGGQVFNVTNALIVHDDANARTEGDTRLLAISGMRTLSQRIFSKFHEEFVKPGRNYLAAVEETSEQLFFGAAEEHLKNGAEQIGAAETLQHRLLATKSMVKTFVIYQLTNRKPPTGSGVGCGYYDPEGRADKSDIASLMNKYIFEVCFNPELDSRNVYRFADYCLCKLANGFWSSAEDEDDGYFPTPASLSDELDASELVAYWEKFGPTIKQMNLPNLNSRVFTHNYSADYKTDLPRVYDVLDSMISGGSSQSSTSVK